MMNEPYLDRNFIWKQRVADYNRHLVLRVVKKEPSQQHEQYEQPEGKL